MFGGRKCNPIAGEYWEVYCNEDNGWCGFTAAHRDMQSSTAYDAPRVDSALQRENYKCVDGASRLFKYTDVADADACAAACSATSGCTHFSFGLLIPGDRNKGMCMGCTSASDPQYHVGFSFYRLVRSCWAAGPMRRRVHKSTQK